MKVCIYCGKSLVGTKDAARKKYCDRECYRSHRLSMPLTNKSTAHYRARESKKTKCELCGGKVNLQVHHKDKNHLNDSPENLQTLCSVCHHKIHMKNVLSMCAVCGKLFRAASHRNRNKICSAQCARVWGRISAKKRWSTTV